MSLPRKPRRRRIKRWTEIQRARKQKSVPLLTENRYTDHLYATRSKSVRNIASQTVMTNVPILSKKSSDNSVIYLGCYRKIPELINLVDNDDNYEEKVTNQPVKTTSKPQVDSVHRKKKLTEMNASQYPLTKKCGIKNTKMNQLVQ
ncbi:uncharacterized protein LOC143146719 [Ptiloglossa arizonensis]|uniref:uncharacterized protein LOC143146719 n=1 Tax=Ptiloglossa arizonensis TaxID=3350558 RepID=UPI003F9F6D74